MQDADSQVWLIGNLATLLKWGSLDRSWLSITITRHPLRCWTQATQAGSRYRLLIVEWTTAWRSCWIKKLLQVVKGGYNWSFAFYWSKQWASNHWCSYGMQAVALILPFMKSWKDRVRTRGISCYWDNAYWKSPATTNLFWRATTNLRRLGLSWRMLNTIERLAWWPWNVKIFYLVVLEISHCSYVHFPPSL